MAPPSAQRPKSTTNTLAATRKTQFRKKLRTKITSNSVIFKTESGNVHGYQKFNKISVLGKGWVKLVTNLY